MPEYLIKWNAGWGDNYEVVEVKDENEAEDAAYRQALEEFETNADWGVVGEATEELKEEYL